MHDSAEARKQLSEAMTAEMLHSGCLTVSFQFVFRSSITVEHGCDITDLYLFPTLMLYHGQLNQNTCLW